MRWSQENSQRLRNPLTDNGGIHKPEGGDDKILQGIGEEIIRHPSSIWFCDLNIGLGEVTVS